VVWHRLAGREADMMRLSDRGLVARGFLVLVTWIFGAASQPAPVTVSSQFIYERASLPSAHASTIAETREGIVAASRQGD